jgi:hypothetical protein
MKLTLRATALIVLLLAAATIASANGVSLTLNNGGNDVMGGVFVGPYNFTTSNGQSLQLVCDDFYNDVSIGESWTASTSTVSSLSGVMFAPGNPQYQTQYQEVAWLVEQMSANKGNAQTVGYIQWAIWAIFDPAIMKSGWTDPYGSITSDMPGITWWYDQALACETGNNNCTYPNYTIYTPPLTGPGQPQEYFGIVATPEPSSLALLVAGMLALMLLVIRRGRA